MAFDKKTYDNEFRKNNYKQFKVNLQNEEKEKLDQFLEKENISKADFLRRSIQNWKEGIRNMKITELEKLNVLNQKATILLNNHIEDTFYDYYFENNLDWFLKNEDKINNDFNENIEKLKFDIILNSDLDERINLILSLKNVSIEEFSNYICFIPYENLKTVEKKKVENFFDEFKNIKDDYESYIYFLRISRK